MHFTTLTLLALAASSSLAAPEPTQHRRNEIQNRQDQTPNNIPQLLTLASLAALPLPTDPTVLLRLGPLAAQLASALPTAPVLSALETAAPRSFLSNIVHDPAYASSFESAFAAGSSPSWFNALPTSVKSYLHTYTGFAGVATAAGELAGVTGSGSGTGSTAAAAATETGSGSTGSAQSTTAGTTSSQATAAAAAATSASAAKGEAGKVVVAGIVGAVGVLGVVVVL
ncbi:MAG: hypothetical protein HETSPECPRED_009817 [Heterodermia speciosa]|uniref:Uncharacterized protein n=1 Tax=Heterodermia speciosa TaxID=116794 RepID=A0A8H3G6K4_9LECA|nr:MAG: hypothetical protein HETSPECPRED_009817 [Heterodermia speciosa]